MKKIGRDGHSAGVVIMTAIFLVLIILQKPGNRRGKTEETMKISPWKK